LAKYAHDEVADIDSDEIELDDVLGNTDLLDTLRVSRPVDQRLTIKQ
jgi:hypothetical protein